MIVQVLICLLYEKMKDRGVITIRKCTHHCSHQTFHILICHFHIVGFHCSAFEFKNLNLENEENIFDVGYQNHLSGQLFLIVLFPKTYEDLSKVKES